MSSLFEPDNQHSKPNQAHNLYLRVAVERAIDKGDAGQGLFYASKDPAISIGQRVRVPLGRSSKPVWGIVVQVGQREILGTLSPNRVKNILDAADACLSLDLIDLATWISRYYCCPLGMVMATMLPAAVKQKTGSKTRTVVSLPPPPTHPHTTTPSDDIPPPKLPRATAQAWEKIQSLAPDQLPMEPRALAQLLELKNAAPINRLVALGLLEKQTQSIIHAPPPIWESLSVRPSDESLQPHLTPTADQARIITGIAQTLNSFHIHLIQGITGSGKTLVYIQLIEQILQNKQSAIVLVPEIALTPQTAERFLSRFANQGVAVLHSGLTASQRHRQWARCASGEASVVIGARSAIFAPMHNLGLIVVDEEHDTSYKQDQSPRYNAKDVAIKRAQIASCPVVLGSATPSLESWANTQQHSARWSLWSLNKRIGNARLPVVRVVDLLQEKKLAQQQRKPVGLLGPTLENALKLTLKEQSQAILLLNRRGFANCIVCSSPNCDWSLVCDHCDANMVLHTQRSLRTGGFVRCHHCLAERLIPKTCPQCSCRVITLGMGTQRVESELEPVLKELGMDPAQAMKRVDSDTMRSARDYFSILSAFSKGEIRLLVGTQMLAKGLDYPNIRLVGVISADTALGLPDFRAQERTFQLVSQVAGRCGRGDKPGLVIVQSFNPDEPAIQLAARHDFVAFAQRELAIRKSCHLPPISRMARVVCRDKSFDVAQANAERIAEALRQNASADIRIEGPMPATLARVADHHRSEVLIIAPDASRLQQILAQTRQQGFLISDAHTAVDVDPVSLM